MTTLHSLFPCVVSEHKLNFDTDTIKEECYKRKQLDIGRSSQGKHPTSNRGGWQSNSFFKDTDSFFGPLLHSIEEHCLNYIHEIVSIQNCFLHNAWININSKGDSNFPHDHPGSIVSGVYYVRLPENSGRLVFQNPSGKLISTYWNMKGGPNEWNRANSEVWSLDSSEDTLLIFPSWLDHFVQPSESDEDRISISFNVCAR
tara:strand:- start:340 stop:942 length:603 start_codon:yes stop_codon:yes gene_type:complete